MVRRKAAAKSGTGGEAGESGSPELRVEYVSLDDLKEWPSNPKLHDVDSIAESIRRFGFVTPIVVDESTGRIVAGHGRREALQQLRILEAPPPKNIKVDGGRWMVPIISGSSFSSEDEAERFLLADNRLVELGGWDDDALSEFIRGIDNFSDSDPLLGWSSEEVSDLLGLGVAVEEPVLEVSSSSDLDGVPGVSSEAAVTNPGDVWILGPHRILCGDATKRPHLRALMSGEIADLLLTDPPGDLSQAEMPVSFALALEFLSKDARIYICAGSANLSMYLTLFKHHLDQFPRLLVWVKEGFVLRPNNYHSQFDLIFFGWLGKGGGRKFWFGERKDSDVWTIARTPTDEKGHQTQKPVELMARAIRNSLAVNSIVLDPFIGSGTTLIAAESEGRRCFGMEIDPRLCDVIVRRWQEMTGLKPERRSLKGEIESGNSQSQATQD